MPGPIWSSAPCRCLPTAPFRASANANTRWRWIVTWPMRMAASAWPSIALALDRNLADAHGCIGMAKYFVGRAQETEAHIREALRLSPHDVFAYRWMLFVGIAKAQLGADGEAAGWLRRSIEANRNFPLAHFHLAEALALLGQLDDARAAAQAGLALDPGFNLRRYRVNALSDNPAYLAGRERSCEGMRLAGVPEE